MLVLRWEPNSMTFVLMHFRSLLFAIHVKTLATYLLSTSLQVTSDTIGALYIIAVLSAYIVIYFLILHYTRH